MGNTIKRYETSQKEININANSIIRYETKPHIYCHKILNSIDAKVKDLNQQFFARIKTTCQNLLELVFLDR